MTSTPFFKLHGLGNDFALFDGLQRPLPPWVADPEHVIALCDRHRGIGADGFLLVEPARDDPQAHARMRVINADGSEPQMCGNGIRCVARYLHEHVAALADANPLLIETAAGTRACALSFDASGALDRIAVAMGRVVLERSALPMAGAGRFIEQPIELAGGQVVLATALSLGNPHLVVFVDDATTLPDMATRLGPLLERHELFPERTNVELVTVRGAALDVVVWERGCGITQACGTGACAAAAAATLTQRLGASGPIPVRLPGGTLLIEIAADLSTVTMSGPAVEVFSGVLDDPR